MTQINNMTPEVMGWELPSFSDVGRALAAPLRATTHTVMEVGRGIRDLDPGRIITAPIKGGGKAIGEIGRAAGFAVNTKTAAEIIADKKRTIKTNVAKIAGSNYAGILPFLNAAMKAFQSLPASAKAEMQPVYMNGINKARKAYIQNANTLMNLYRSFLSSSNPQEVTGAIQSYTLDMQSLIDSKHSTGSTKEVDSKDNEMRALLTSLQNYGENISSRQINLVEEQTRQQGRIIDYETGGTGNGLSLGKLLIPAALGVGAIMLLKG